MKSEFSFSNHISREFRMCSSPSLCKPYVILMSRLTVLLYFYEIQKKKKKWKKCSVSSSVLRLLLLQWGIRLEQSQLWTDETCPVTSTRVWSCQASSVCAILKSSGYSILRVVVITSHICRSLKVSCCS